MRKYKIIALLVTISFLSIVYSENVEAATARSVCANPNCASSWDIMEKCNREGWYEGERTHEYGGILGIFNTKTCTVISKQSTMTAKCNYCGTVAYSTTLGHHCIEIHTDCGEGVVYACPFQ